MRLVYVCVCACVCMSLRALTRALNERWVDV